MQDNRDDSGPKLPSLVVLGAITAVAAFVVIGFALGWFVANSPATVSDVTAVAPTPQQVVATAPAATPTPASSTQTQPPSFEAKPAPNAPDAAPNPLFGPNFDPTDGKPIFVCGIESAPSYLTLLHMQMSGADVAHGFHLGVVPIELEQAPYEIDEDTMRGYMRRGDWDCIIEEIDENFIGNYGIVTALVDESIGENGIWGRGIATYYDLQGKRVAFEEKSSAHFFLLYVLSILPEDIRASVSLLPFRTGDAAQAAFAEGRADAVSGSGAALFSTAKSGGQPIISSEQLRIIANALMTSRKAVAEKPDLVQAFHAAWFRSLKTQTEDYDAAAKLIAQWGHNEWTGVSVENAASDYRNGFKQMAQADLRDNLNIMRNTVPIVDRLNISRQLWVGAGYEVVSDAPEDLVAARFVLGLAEQTELFTENNPVNNAFTLATTQDSAVAQSKPEPTAASVANVRPVSQTQAVLTLPCRKFSFLPNSTELTQDAKSTLDRCVMPALHQRASLKLVLVGSSAWPGPAGKFSAAQIEAFGRARAQAIAQYLITQNISSARLVVQSSLPPIAHRESRNENVMAEDRFVEMSLVSEQ